ncbi:Hypothetical protein POVR1_LOCUS585 [uncultured virus]|nr:Hypothetical protein POVR1_LOCUS585 [uncultured virus]
MELQVVTFNVLAPSWVSSKLYPSSCLDDYFHLGRLKKKIQYIQETLNGADIYCLEETQHNENVVIAQAFPDYDVCAVYHDDNYWTRWKTNESIFYPNGVAVAINKNRFKLLKFFDQPLSKSGNHAAIVICEDRQTSLKIRISAIHLDTGAMKFAEISSLVDFLEEEKNQYIDLIAGDFNSNIRSFSILKMAEFLDLSHNDNVSTIPMTSKAVLGSIDHIVIRTRRMTAGGVIMTRSTVHEIGNSCKTVQTNGSDHYAVECQFTIS